MALTQSPMPVRNPMIDPASGLITRQWRTWLRSRSDIVNETPVRVGGVSLTEQAASIPPTDFPLLVSGGLYRASVFARRTVVATGAAPSSGLGVIIRFRSGGQALSVATPVNANNTLTDLVTGVWLIQADPESKIAYEVAYGSVDPATMQYSLDIVIEQVQV